MWEKTVEIAMKKMREILKKYANVHAQLSILFNPDLQEPYMAPQTYFVLLDTI